MLKKESIKYVLMWLPAAILYGIFFMLFVTAPNELKAYTADADGSLIMNMNESIYIIDPVGGEKKIPCNNFTVQRIEVSSEKITLRNSLSYIDYYLDSDSFGERTACEEPIKAQNIKEPLTIGDATYTYKSSWGRWSIIQTNADGSTLTRYQLSAGSWAVRIAFAVLIVVNTVAMILLLIHFYKNYEYKKSGIFWVCVPKDTNKEEDRKWIKKGAAK